eukprot:1789215-Ditylum_brightwellii.AAC.1
MGQHITAHHSISQHNTAQYSTAKTSTAQHSTSENKAIILSVREKYKSELAHYEKSRRGHFKKEE